MSGKGFVLAVLVAFAISGCSDDDAPARDAGSGAVAGRGGSGGGGSGGTRCPSCGDNYNCFSYPLEAFSWPDGIGGDMTRRVPLVNVCFNECKLRESLAEFTARLRCVEVADDGGVDVADGGGVEGLQDEVDGGLFAGPWERSEGCGSVQFSTVAPGPPRIFNFDDDTGELIGFARFDASGTWVPGSGFGCSSPGWVAGMVRGHCANETVSLCELR